MIRLGIPVVIGIIVLEPIARSGIFLMPASITGIDIPPNWSMYPDLMGLGPLWFIVLLLAFDVLYAIWRQLAGIASVRSKKIEQTARHNSGKFPGYFWLLALILTLTAVTYVNRVVVPFSHEIRVYFSFLNFPSLAYLPQYLSMFVLGTVAFRRNWLSHLHGSMGIVGFVLAAVATLTFYPFAFSGPAMPSGYPAFLGFGT